MKIGELIEQLLEYGDYYDTEVRVLTSDGPALVTDVIPDGRRLVHLDTRQPYYIVERYKTDGSVKRTEHPLIGYARRHRDGLKQVDDVYKVLIMDHNDRILEEWTRH